MNTVDKIKQSKPAPNIPKISGVKTAVKVFYKNNELGERRNKGTVRLLHHESATAQELCTRVCPKKRADAQM